MVLESKKQSYGFRMGLALFRLQCLYFSCLKLWDDKFHACAASQMGFAKTARGQHPCLPLVSENGRFTPKWSLYTYICRESRARDNESNDDWPVDLGMRYHSQFSDKNHCHNSWFLWHEAGIKDFSYIVPACIHKRASWLLLAASRTKMQETWPGSGSPGWLGHLAS